MAVAAAVVDVTVLLGRRHDWTTYDDDYCVDLAVGAGKKLFEINIGHETKPSM